MAAKRIAIRKIRDVLRPKFEGKLSIRQINASTKTSSVSQRSQHSYLFSTQNSARFSANTATQHLKRLYARAGISGAMSHSGRRTWLTALSQRGVSVFVLAEMAGHRSIQTTQR